jgi:hypothetical protein
LGLRAGFPPTQRQCLYSLLFDQTKEGRLVANAEQ